MSGYSFFQSNNYRLTTSAYEKVGFLRARTTDITDIYRTNAVDQSLSYYTF